MDILFAWCRVGGYLFVGYMIAQAAAYAVKFSYALYMTSGGFVLLALAAFFLACGQSAARDLVLAFNTVYFVALALAWARAILHLGRA